MDYLIYFCSNLRLRLYLLVPNKKGCNTLMSQPYVYRLCLNFLTGFVPDLYAIVIKTINIIKYIANANIIGDITVIQPQSITPTSFSAINTSVRTSKNPMFFPSQLMLVNTKCSHSIRIIIKFLYVYLLNVLSI